MGDALIAALSSKLNDEGRCNEGFLRDDALLFIVVINDTEDTESTSWPYQQYNAIIAAKKDPNAVIMLAVHTAGVARATRNGAETAAKRVAEP